MSREYTTAQLERMVLGQVEEPNVVFYEQSMMDVDASKIAGRRVYNTALMIKVTQPGVTDWAPYRAQKADIVRNPEAYQRFLTLKGDVGSPSVQIIPGILPDEAQELIDYGIHTITKLCEAEVLPAHLLYIQASARRINEVFKHEQEKNSHGTIGDRETHNVPATGGRNDPADAGRSMLPAGDSAEVGPVAGGLRPGGRLDGGPGITGTDVRRDRPRSESSAEAFLTPNWRLTFGETARQT